MSVYVNLDIKDNENRNVVLPVTGYRENIFNQDEKAIGHLIKIDTSKDTWGDISITISTKRPYSGNVTSINTSSTQHFGATMSSYSNVGSSGQTQYYGSYGVGVSSDGEVIGGTGT